MQKITCLYQSTDAGGCLYAGRDKKLAAHPVKLLINVIMLKSDRKKVPPFSFHFIEDDAGLPRNITTVQAPDLAQALPIMFQAAADDNELNFIVWNPPSPVFSGQDLMALESLRLSEAFNVYAPDIEKLKNKDIEVCPQLGNEYSPLISSIEKHIATIGNAIGEARNSGLLKMAQPGYYELHGDEDAPLSRVPETPDFHIDTFNGSRYLRILAAHRGPGTYVMGTEDIKYTKSFFQAFNEAVITGRAPRIWMLKEGAYALMKSGGDQHDIKEWKPAYHGTPFQNPDASTSDKRIFERTDIALLTP